MRYPNRRLSALAATMAVASIVSVLLWGEEVQAFSIQSSPAAIRLKNHQHQQQQQQHSHQEYSKDHLRTTSLPMHKTTSTKSSTSSIQQSVFPHFDLSWCLTTVLAVATVASSSSLCWAADTSGGATSAANAKITTGGASTLQSGRTIAITRGVNLDNSDFHGQNLKGVAFQQSIVRDSNFEGSSLVGSSFFDATVDGSNFKDADMSLANIEMAQFDRANLHNTIMREVYVSGATLFEGVADIEGSDWTDTFLRKDQQKYLCNHPTAKGTNPVTGVDTRESLMCKD